MFPPQYTPGVAVVLGVCCPGGNCLRWHLSWVVIVLGGSDLGWWFSYVAVVRVARVRRGNCPRWQLFYVAVVRVAIWLGGCSPDTVEQLFDCFIIQVGQVMHSKGRSMDWTVNDNMVNGLFFCATLIKPLKGPWEIWISRSGNVRRRCRGG